MNRASADVKRVATEHLARIEQKIAELQSMHQTLSELVEACRGDHRPDCPISHRYAEYKFHLPPNRFTGVSVLGYELDHA